MDTTDEDTWYLLTEWCWSWDLYQTWHYCCVLDQLLFWSTCVQWSVSRDQCLIFRNVLENVRRLLHKHFPSDQLTIQVQVPWILSVLFLSVSTVTRLPTVILSQDLVTMLQMEIWFTNKQTHGTQYFLCQFLSGEVSSGGGVTRYSSIA